MKSFILLSSLTSALLLSACGGGGGSSNDSTPTTKPTPSNPSPNPTPSDPEPPKSDAYVPSQYKTLNNGFQYVKTPLEEIRRNPFYDLRYWVDASPLQISSYTYSAENAQQVFKNITYSTESIYSKTWISDPTTSLVFNIQKNQWVTSNGDSKLSQGPLGTQGIPSVHVSSDQGESYFTLIEKDLGGLTLKEGMNQGFGDGIPLPDVVNTARFSSGAKAYSFIKDNTQPGYVIYRTHQVFSTRYTIYPIGVCETGGTSCSQKASNLEQAISLQGWSTNIGKTASIQIQDHSTAKLIVNDKKNQNYGTYTIQYSVINAKKGTPKHILFNTSDKASTEALKDYFGTGDSYLAWYEYNDTVVHGYYRQPMKGVQTSAVSYNKTAVNDILTQWSPARLPVLE